MRYRGICGHAKITVVHAPPFGVTIIKRFSDFVARSAHREVSGNSRHEHANRHRLAWLIVAAIVLAGAITSLSGLTQATWLDDVSVTAVADRALPAAVANWWERYKQRKVALLVAGTPFELRVDQLGCQLDVGRTLQRILALKQKHFWQRRIGRSVNTVDPVVVCQDDELSKWIDDLEQRGIRQAPHTGKLSWEKGAVVGQSGSAGDLIRRSAIREDLEQHLLRWVASSYPVPLVHVEARPSTTQLHELAQKANRYIRNSVLIESKEPPLRAHLLRSDLGRMIILRENSAGDFQLGFDAGVLSEVLRTRHISPAWPAKNATLEVRGSQFSVVPDARGYKFSVERLAERLLDAVQQGSTRVTIDVELGAEAKIKASDVEHLGIRELMGAFTTRHACCQPRVNNIHRIADILNGMIVLPGETFSINEVVGPRSLANGFVPAPSIEDGEMVDTIGGGVSQFATTFYNALLRSGLEILERRAHSYWFERYPMGHEATLSIPKPDLVFRNDTHAGVLIKTEYTDKSITVKLYGDKENRRVNFGVSKMMDVEQPPVERLPNAEVDPEEEHTKAPGRMGWSVMTWRTVTLANGEQKKDERKVTYKPQVRRVEVHPCKLKPDELGYTGERCPAPKPSADAERK